MPKNESTPTPLVSAVIPTRNRPDLVCRAVRSVLSQTYANLEVMVVVDGPDTDTVMALEAMNQPSVHIIALAVNVGGSEARNIGVREAKGEWVALLDDDDEWLPEKIEKQISAIRAKKGEIVFSATRYFDRHNGKSHVRPRCFPSPEQHISEYIFCEMDRVGRRDCFLQTSTWVVQREFFLRHSFSKGLKKNQDTDWLLRAFPDCGDRYVFISEPLASFYRHPGLKRISTTLDWEYTFQWVEGNSHLFTPLARACVFMTECARSANRQGAGVRTIALLWSKCEKAAKRSPRLIFCLVIALLHHVMLCFRRKQVAYKPTSGIACN